MIGKSQPVPPVHTAHSAQASDPPATRKTWIDAVKGIAILLVVFMHLAILAEPFDWSGPHLGLAASLLVSARMPLFFAMSGYFLTRRLDRSWAWWARNRIAPFIYLFVLWTGIWAVFSGLTAWERLDGSTWRDLPNLLGNPNMGPWYIFALALYFVITKAMRKLPVAAQIGVGLVVSIPTAVGVTEIADTKWAEIILYYICFLIGVHGNWFLETIAENAKLLPMLGLAAIWLGLNAFMYLKGIDIFSWLRIPLTILGMAAGVMFATLVDRHLPMLKLRWFGSHTLPIYLVHIPVLGVAYAYTPALPTESFAIQIFYPLLIGALSVAVALGLWKAFKNVPGLFVAPWRGESVQTMPLNRPQPVGIAA